MWGDFAFHELAHFVFEDAQIFGHIVWRGDLKDVHGRVVEHLKAICHSVSGANQNISYPVVTGEVDAVSEANCIRVIFRPLPPFRAL